MAQDINCEISPEIEAKIFEVAKASVAGNASFTGRGAVGSKVWSEDEVTVMTRVLQETNQDEVSTLQLCVLIAAQLPSKNIRDVAARLILLRNQDPETASVAAAAMGAVAAAAGVSVPGATSSSDMSGTWRDPVAMFSGPNSVIDGNHPSSFPFELQVAQLLQENMILIEELRDNVLGAKFAENVPLMQNFHQNVATIFSMLSSLPCALPPLPVQYKINNTFTPELTPQHQHSLRLEQFQGMNNPGNEVDRSFLTPPGDPGSAYGLQAGIAYPYHPNSTQRASKSTSSSSSSSAPPPPPPSTSSSTAAASSGPPMNGRPPNISTDQSQGSTLPAPSPANGALQALPQTHTSS